MLGVHKHPSLGADRERDVDVQGVALLVGDAQAHVISAGLRVVPPQRAILSGDPVDDEAILLASCQLFPDGQARGTAVVQNFVAEGPGTALDRDGNLPVQARIGVLRVDPVGRFGTREYQEHGHLGRFEVALG